MSGWLLYSGAAEMVYAASVAATWAWAPALFVSADLAKNYGLFGLLVFAIPNALTLAVFAHFAQKIRQFREGITIGDVVSGAGKPQQYLHTAVSVVYLVCSTMTQFIGLHLWLTMYAPVAKSTVALFLIAATMLVVWERGLKGSILTDYGKYMILFAGGLFLAAFSFGESLCASGSIQLPALAKGNTADFLVSFGIGSTIGLIAAPYADQTFWQRAFSMSSETVKSAFTKAAMLFLPIPLLFGAVGLYGADISGGIPAVVFGVCVLAALLSTIDSNACAAASLTKDISKGRLAMLGLLFGASAAFVSFDMTIPQMFLLYGTIRSALAVPTVLIILGLFDKNRLFAATLAAVLIGGVGYALTRSVIYTLAAFLLPLLGFKKGD